MGLLFCCAISRNHHPDNLVKAVALLWSPQSNGSKSWWCCLLRKGRGCHRSWKRGARCQKPW